jgi:hypothetical protein
MSMDGVHNRGSVGAPPQDSGVKGVQGKFGDRQVEVGEAQPRAGNAIRKFFLEVKHFFASLFGIRVSPIKPPTIESVRDGVNSVVSDFARKTINPFDALKSLGALHEQCHFELPENRKTDGSRMPKIDGMFRERVGELSDLQLLRLYRNLSQNREYLIPLTQLGTGVMAENISNIKEENIYGSGKINDLGFIATELAETVIAELRGRGIEVADIQYRREDTTTPQIEAVVLRTIQNGGDVGRASDEAYEDMLNQRLERSGLPRLDELSPEPQPTIDPDRMRAINERLEASGLSKPK